MVMFLIISGITFAQERGGGERPSRTNEASTPVNRGERTPMTPEQRVRRQTQQLVKELKLNKEQELKVAAVYKKYMVRQSGDWSKMRDASDEERAKMREERNKVQAEKTRKLKQF